MKANLTVPFWHDGDLITHLVITGNVALTLAATRITSLANLAAFNTVL